MDRQEWMQAITDIENVFYEARTNSEYDFDEHRNRVIQDTKFPKWNKPF